jgi:glutamine amidotransferase
MITILDYGLGNVRAFCNVYKRLNIEVKVAQTAQELRTATKILLPGVGAFDHALERLEQSGMRQELEDRVRGAGALVLGVCVGMQILANSSEEGRRAGFGWIPGQVKRFELRDASRYPLPHMGWNDVRAARRHGLFEQMESDARFYFLHSYYFNCDDPNDVLATAEYGEDFACAVARANVYGVQFHPEKSHHFGAQLLKNFANL